MVKYLDLEEKFIAIAKLRVKGKSGTQNQIRSCSWGWGLSQFPSQNRGKIQSQSQN